MISPWRSPLVHQHDGHHPPCDRGIGGVLGPIGQRQVVVVELECDTLPLVLETAEIVLVVRVVVRGEGVEGLHPFEDLSLRLATKGDDASCEHHLAAGEGEPKGVVEAADDGAARGFCKRDGVALVVAMAGAFNVVVHVMFFHCLKKRLEVETADQRDGHTIRIGEGEGRRRAPRVRSSPCALVEVAGGDTGGGEGTVLRRGGKLFIEVSRADHRHAEGSRGSCDTMALPIAVSAWPDEVMDRDQGQVRRLFGDHFPPLFEEGSTLIHGRPNQRAFSISREPDGRQVGEAGTDKTANPEGIVAAKQNGPPAAAKRDHPGGARKIWPIYRIDRASSVGVTVCGEGLAREGKEVTTPPGANELIAANLLAGGLEIDACDERAGGGEIGTEGRGVGDCSAAHQRGFTAFRIEVTNWVWEPQKPARQQYRVDGGPAARSYRLDDPRRQRDALGRIGRGSSVVAVDRDADDRAGWPTELPSTWFGQDGRQGGSITVGDHGRAPLMVWGRRRRRTDGQAPVERREPR